MQRQGNFTPGLWLRPGAVALGGWGRRAERRRGRWARLCLCRAERPGGGTGVRGHSQDTASSARGALPAEGRDCAEPPPGPQHPLLGGAVVPVPGLGTQSPRASLPAPRPPGKAFGSFAHWAHLSQLPWASLRWRRGAAPPQGAGHPSCCYKTRAPTPQTPPCPTLPGTK